VSEHCNIAPAEDGACEALTDCDTRDADRDGDAAVLPLRERDDLL
jgi:hypothetical protein